MRITYVKDPEVLKLQLAGGQYDWGGMSFNPDTVLYQQQEAGNYSLVPGENSQYWVGLKINHAWLAVDHEDPQEQKLVELLRNFDFSQGDATGHRQPAQHGGRSWGPSWRSSPPLPRVTRCCRPDCPWA